MCNEPKAEQKKSALAFKLDRFSRFGSMSGLSLRATFVAVITIVFHFSVFVNSGFLFFFCISAKISAYRLVICRILAACDHIRLQIFYPSQHAMYNCLHECCSLISIAPLFKNILQKFVQSFPQPSVLSLDDKHIIHKTEKYKKCA